MKPRVDRRAFVIGSTVVGTASSMWTARSSSRVQGANDRINIGFLGCGARSRGHRRMVEMSLSDRNLGVVAVCDIWTLNREKAAADCRDRFGVEVKQFKYAEEMLAMPELDAVMIATGDHQHGRLLAEVVRAGKDCYVEKPMALDVAEAKLAREAVLNTRQIVQNGSQWLSCPYHLKVREIIRSGRLGQITKIEQVWNDNNHRWYDPADPDVAALKQEDTDWERWLAGKPYRPFNRRAYFEFRIFRDYSGGITSQWLSHGIGLAHFFTDTAIPDDMVAAGGIYGWPDIRQNPDTFHCLANFREAGILYSFSSSYANRFGDHTCIRGKDATLFAQGGEGSPRWFLIPEVKDDGRHFFGGFEEAVRTGAAELVTPDGRGELPPTAQSDDSKPHLDNWIDCMRNRTFMTNGHIHTGFWHSVASEMATRAYRENRKVFWDREKEEIVEQSVL